MSRDQPTLRNNAVYVDHIYKQVTARPAPIRHFASACGCRTFNVTAGQGKSNVGFSVGAGVWACAGGNSSSKSHVAVHWDGFPLRCIPLLSWHVLLPSPLSASPLSAPLPEFCLRDGMMRCVLPIPTRRERNPRHQPVTLNTWLEDKTGSTVQPADLSAKRCVLSCKTVDLDITISDLPSK